MPNSAMDGEDDAWTTCRSLLWALEAAVLQAIAGAFSWEKELQSKCGTAGSPITLLLCSLFQSLTMFRDNSRRGVNEA